MEGVSPQLFTNPVAKPVHPFGFGGIGEELVQVLLGEARVHAHRFLPGAVQKSLCLPPHSWLPGQTVPNLRAHPELVGSRCTLVISLPKHVPERALHEGELAVDRHVPDEPRRYDGRRNSQDHRSPAQPPGEGWGPGLTHAGGRATRPPGQPEPAGPERRRQDGLTQNPNPPCQSRQRRPAQPTGSFVKPDETEQEEGQESGGPAHRLDPRGHVDERGVEHEPQHGQDHRSRPPPPVGHDPHCGHRQTGHPRLNALHGETGPDATGTEGPVGSSEEKGDRRGLVAGRERLVGEEEEAEALSGNQ